MIDFNRIQFNQDEESEKLQYIMEVCGVQEKLETFELIYGTELMDYWYTIDMKDMFNTLIEILNAVCALTPTLIDC